MEPVFGAFVAGHPDRPAPGGEPAEAGPLRTVVLSVLAPLFLATAGLRMDLTALADPEVALGRAGGAGRRDRSASSPARTPAPG